MVLAGATIVVEVFVPDAKLEDDAVGSHRFSGSTGDSFGDGSSSVTGELAGFVDRGDVYLLVGGVKRVTAGAEMPFTASTGFDS